MGKSTFKKKPFSIAMFSYQSVYPMRRYPHKMASYPNLCCITLNHQIWNISHHKKMLYVPLVGGIPTPFKKIMEFVSWDDDIPNLMDIHKIHLPNHQPDHVNITSQCYFDLPMVKSCELPQIHRSSPGHIVPCGAGPGVTGVTGVRGHGMLWPRPEGQGENAMSTLRCGVPLGRYRFVAFTRWENDGKMIGNQKLMEF